MVERHAGEVGRLLETKYSASSSSQRPWGTKSKNSNDLPSFVKNNLQKCPISAMQKLHETFPLGLTNNFHGVLYHSRRLRIDWIAGHFVWQAFLKI